MSCDNFEYETFEQAERLLRELKADDAAVVELGPDTVAYHRECVSLCEEILIWKEKFNQKKPSEPELESLDISVKSPEDHLLEQTRQEISTRYEQEAAEDLRVWLQFWSLRVDGAVFERSLAWVRRASEELLFGDRVWSAALARPRRLGFWGRLRVFRLARKTLALEGEVADLDRELVMLRERGNRALADTKLLAGMVSVFLKVHSGAAQSDNRIVNRVLELDREREVERQLEKRCEAARSRIRDLQDQERALREATVTRKNEHRRSEQNKNVRMLDAWTEGRQDPRDLMAKATEAQIVSVWGDVERRLQKELSLTRDAKTQEHQLEDEFERLVGVIREYQKAAEAEKGHSDQSSGVSPETQVGSCSPGAEARH